MANSITLNTGMASLDEWARQLPEALSGQRGVNRSWDGPCQIPARNDVEAVESWLSEYESRPQTWRAYRKEAERLLLWCWLSCGKALSSLNRDDIRQYMTFMADPQPRERWCGPRASKQSAQWRPFQGPLSERSIQQACRILKSLFQYLQDAAYLSGNPFALVKSKPQLAEPHALRERHLDHQSWQALISFLADLNAEEGHRREAEIQRWRFMLAFWYGLAPRVHEVAAAKMNDLFEWRGRWWWRVLGKGQKYAEVPVPEAVLTALVSYRRYLGLSDYPDVDDASPMIRRLSGVAGVTANMLYRSLKRLTDEASVAVRAEQPEIANRLSQASTHWFRHTSITHYADAGMELRFLARQARHASLATTRLYLHEDDQDWADQQDRMKWQMPWQHGESEG